MTLEMESYFGQMEYVDGNDFYDVLIVGSGPAALATAARLREQTPAALFTDAEHARFHWLKRHGDRLSVKHKDGSVSVGMVKQPSDEERMVVVDVTGEWLGQWKKLFDALQITHLRSPMFFHPDPSDVDGLVAFAHTHGRAEELKEIKGVVGKELSKHKRKQQLKGRRHELGGHINERERIDYCTPSTSVFGDYCQSIIERYGLQDAVVKDKVTSIDYVSTVVMGSVDTVPHLRFKVVTAGGRVMSARSVVLAVGGGGIPMLPSCIDEKSQAGACHCFHLAQKSSVICAHVAERIRSGKETQIVIVGGGLTSAQIADLAIAKGVSKVYLLCRGHLKVKHFDVDLEWVGKYRNFKKMTFFGLEDEQERLEMVLAARNGGSVTPDYQKIIASHCKDGRLSLLTQTTITHQEWDPNCKKWSIQLSTGMQLHDIHYIYYATGVKPQVDTLAFLKPLLERCPIGNTNGMPSITDDLMWSASVPCFVVGRLASLKVGPGAGNLEGARSCAERVAVSRRAYIQTKFRSCALKKCVRKKSTASQIETSTRTRFAWTMVLVSQTRSTSS